MATFVQLTEEDPAYDLAALIVQINHASAPAEQKDVKEKQRKELTDLVAAQKYGQIIDTFFNSMDKILAANEKEINTVFNLCFSLLHQLRGDEASQYVARFASALTKDQSHALLKLKLLSTLFNLLGTSHRHLVFLHILRFALATNNSAVLSGQFEHLEQWFQDWRINSAAEAETFLLASQVCKANNHPLHQQKFLLSYFKSLEEVAPEVRAAAKEHAVVAVKASIDSTTSADSDTLLRLAAVKQLSDDEKHRPTYELLRIVTHETVDVYTQFAQQNKAHMTGLGLDEEKLMKKMRYLTISSLGEATPELTYAAIQEKLKLKNRDEVEEQVIEAVACGLIDAKIDQERQVVYIQRTVPRSFTRESWQKLGSSLESWKKNVRDVLGLLQAARAQSKAQ